MHLGGEYEYVDPVTIVINCPACQAINVPATAYVRIETLKAFHVAPVLRLSNTWVECQHCHITLHTTFRINDLLDRSPEELHGMLRDRSAAVGKNCAMLGLMLFWLPVGGLIISVWALANTWRFRGWRRVSLVGLGLTLLMHAWICYNVVSAVQEFELERKKKAKPARSSRAAHVVDKTAPYRRVPWTNATSYQLGGQARGPRAMA